MPTYEYKCDACGGTFEKFQSITAAPIRQCALCGKTKAKRLIGAGGGLIFRGSGFYITDYRSDSYKSAAKSETPASSSGNGAATDSSSSSAKPAETKAATPAATPAPAASSSSAKKKPA